MQNQYQCRSNVDGCKLPFQEGDFKLFLLAEGLVTNIEVHLIFEQRIFQFQARRSRRWTNIISMPLCSGPRGYFGAGRGELLVPDLNFSTKILRCERAWYTFPFFRGQYCTKVLELCNTVLPAAFFALIRCWPYLPPKGERNVEVLLTCSSQSPVDAAECNGQVRLLGSC